MRGVDLVTRLVFPYYDVDKVWYCENPNLVDGGYMKCGVCRYLV